MEVRGPFARGEKAKIENKQRMAVLKFCIWLLNRICLGILLSLENSEIAYFFLITAQCISANSSYETT